MDIVLRIVLTFAIVYGVYMFFSAVISALAARELWRRGISVDTDGDMEIRADAESVEFLARCALWATAFERKRIILKIDENDADAMKTAQILCRRHKNIVIRRN